MFFLSGPDPSGSPPQRAAPHVATANVAEKKPVIIADISSKLNEVSKSENGIDDISSKINEVSRCEYSIDDVLNKLNRVVKYDNGTDSAEGNMEGHKHLYSVDTTSLNLPELTTGELLLISMFRIFIDSLISNQMASDNLLL